VSLDAGRNFSTESFLHCCRGKLALHRTRKEKKHLIETPKSKAQKMLWPGGKRMGEP